MKFPRRINLTFHLITVIWIATCPIRTIGSPDPVPQPSPDSGDHLSNADLHHLLSLLDGSSGTDSDQASRQTVDDLDVGASELLAVTVKPPELTSTTTDDPTSTVRVFTRKLIRRPKSTTTTSTTTERTTTTNSPEPTQSTTSTTQQPSNDENTHALRRQDNQIENLRALVPPSQQELVQQLSMLNSLLTSLGDNVTTTTQSTTSSSTIAPITTTETKPSGNPNAFIEEMLAKIGNASSSNVQKPQTNDPTAALQSLALLNSLFGGSGAPGAANSNANAAAAALLGLSNSGHPNLATRQTVGQGNGQSEAEAAAALSELFRQTAALQGQDVGKNNPFANAQNFQHFQNTNGNLDAASSNQISGLLSLLGTLGSLSQQPQQSNSLFNFAQSNPVQPQQNNFLSNMLQQQPSQANALSSLFGTASQPQNQPFNIGNIFSAQSTAPSIPGLGLLSTVGSLGSTLFSTMSGLLGGSGTGGKPRVRGKGVDTRLGLGYRFGDAADAQIVWDVGPQLYTDAIRNENRPPMIKSKSQQVDPNQQLLSTNARVEKQQQQIAASKRLLQLQMQREMQNHQLLQRRLALHNTPTTKKPLSLLDMWNSGKGSMTEFNRAKIPQQLTIPPMHISQNDAWQMLRHKSFMKRSSSGSLDLKPYYAKPEDDPLAGHSTLTNYEKMLLTRGEDFGMLDKDKKYSYKQANRQKPQSFPNDPPADHGESFHQHSQHSSENHNNPRNRPRPPNSMRPSFLKNKNTFNTNRPRRPPPRPQHSREKLNNSEQSSKPWEEFTSSQTSPPQIRPGQNRHPSRHNSKDVRRRNQGFSFSNFFSKIKRRPSPRRRPPTTSRPAERRFDSNSQFNQFTNSNNKMMADSNDHFNARNRNNQNFKNTNSDMMMEDSDDHFYARNRNKPFFVEEEGPTYNSFARKTSKLPPILQSTLSHKSGLGVSSSSAGVNPEAEDSFIRRNAVVINPQLKEAEKQKMFGTHPTLPSKVVSKNIHDNKNNAHHRRREDLKDEDQGSLKQDSPKKSVMNLLRNFLSSKTKARNSNTTSSISSLQHLLSDPSSLNPLKILPIRKIKRPERPNIKTKLTIVDGKPQIVEVTEAPKKEETKPIVHVGEDMSFEDLTKLFGKAKNTTKGKGRKKLKLKSKTKDPKNQSKANSRADDDEDIEFEDKADNPEKSKAKDDKKEEEEYEDDDGLKGIFIDIDSGEVNVMKPVASLTSFEPKKESSEEEVDEYEDEDGDGVADSDTKRKQEIFDEIQEELKKNYEKLKKAHERAEAKKKRKEELVSKGMDESMDVVSKYFDMIDEVSEDSKKEPKKTLKIKF